MRTHAALGDRVLRDSRPFRPLTHATAAHKKSSQDRAPTGHSLRVVLDAFTLSSAMDNMLYVGL